ncbi:MAG TPA: lipid-A-disaccharide synthase, partial [Candidatus Obscuribacterales bacterium]
DFAAVGFVRLIHKVPMFARIRQDVLRQIKERKPDAVLLVDFGGFNISFSSAVRNRYRDLPIIYFISPQVWGSRPWRLNELARNISKMLVIFPFEEAIYLRRGIPARFVGHPLMKDASRFEEPGNRADFARQHGLDPEAPLIAVFPGSRKQEIKDHCPVVTDAIKWLRAERPAVQFVICQSNEKIGGLIREHLTKAGLAALIGRGIQLIDSSESYKLLKNADVAWAKSGTTTLETTLCGTPMLIFYRADWISYLLFLAAKRVKRVGWPNLLAGRSLVPELIQLDCRAEKLVRYTLDLIDVPALRNEISTELKKLRDQLGQGDFDENAAAEILEIIGCNRQILNPLKP